MIGFLVDTNVLSELCRPDLNAGVAAWSQGVTHFSVSIVSVEEIFYGLHKKPNPKLLLWFERFFQDVCDSIPIDHAIAQTAGSLRGKLAKRGINRSQADMLIAATASAHSLTVVTRNTKDFTGVGIPVLNPFVES